MLKFGDVILAHDSLKQNSCRPWTMPPSESNAWKCTSRLDLGSFFWNGMSFFWNGMSWGLINMFLLHLMCGAGHFELPMYIQILSWKGQSDLGKQVCVCLHVCVYLLCIWYYSSCCWSWCCWWWCCCLWWQCWVWQEVFSASSHHASELRCIRISSASSLLLLSLTLYYINCCYWCSCYSILLCSMGISVIIIIIFMYIDLPLFEGFPGRWTPANKVH